MSGDGKRRFKPTSLDTIYAFGVLYESQGLFKSALAFVRKVNPGCQFYGPGIVSDYGHSIVLLC